MQRFTTITKIVMALVLWGTSISVAAQKPEEHKEKKDHKEKKEAKHLPAVIWRDPGNISARNLLYGAGGAARAPDPSGKFTFIEEDKSGSSPKFDVKDGHGVVWRVKLGAEPQSETAATRLLWAVGYFVDEDYYLPRLKVEGLPKLRRGQNYVSDDGLVQGTRLKRKDKNIHKIGNWDWFKNPFVGTKELDGLRVMMALVNNWDLKEINNAIYVVDGEQRYVVSDLGASFGKTGNTITRSKSDVQGYEKSNFIQNATASKVDFELHSRPFVLTAIDIPNYRARAKMERVTKNIPREDAKWIGQSLGQLSNEQIRDCFRSAGYSREEVETYSNTVLDRIVALNAL
jgi:hypothetical protein